MLLVEALDGVARSAAKAPVSEVAVAVPAHWRPSVVEALRGALGSKPGLARSPLVSDAEAALTALRSNPGLPTAGVIVLCDFGGSGTSITVVDAAANDAPIGETVRVPDFSGDQIDQAILTNVVAGIFDASDADPAGTSMVGSLSVLRDECRRAKERLSDETATAIVDRRARDGDHRPDDPDGARRPDRRAACRIPRGTGGHAWTAIGFRWRASRRLRRSAAVHASR